MATTKNATDITGTTATLNGNIDPSGNTNGITAGFEYGLTTDYGTTVTLTSQQALDYVAGITGLAPLTTYHFRAWVKKNNTYAYGSDLSFTTTNTVTVTFDAQGGAVSPASATATIGLAYGALPIPTRSG